MGLLQTDYQDPKLFAFKVDGTGTAKLTGSGANQATLTDNGTGDYSITLNTAATNLAGGVAAVPAAAVDCDFDVIAIVAKA